MSDNNNKNLGTHAMITVALTLNLYRETTHIYHNLGQRFTLPPEPRFRVDDMFHFRCQAQRYGINYETPRYRVLWNQIRPQPLGQQTSFYQPFMERFPRLPHQIIRRAGRASIPVLSAVAFYEHTTHLGHEYISFFSNAKNRAVEKISDAMDLITKRQ